jgi:hypothetical protein
VILLRDNTNECTLVIYYLTTTQPASSLTPLATSHPAWSCQYSVFRRPANVAHRLFHEGILRQSSFNTVGALNAGKLNRMRLHSYLTRKHCAETSSRTKAVCLWTSA